MKKASINREFGCMVLFDPETQAFKWEEGKASAVNKVFPVREDMLLTKEDGEEIELKQGDIVLTFWRSSALLKTIIIKSQEWFETILRDEEIEQKAKEEWAKRKAKQEESYTSCEICNECQGR